MFSALHFWSVVRILILILVQPFWLPTLNKMFMWINLLVLKLPEGIGFHSEKFTKRDGLKQGERCLKSTAEKSWTNFVLEICTTDSCCCSEDNLRINRKFMSVCWWYIRLSRSFSIAGSFWKSFNEFFLLCTMVREVSLRSSAWAITW